jgi:hypothetical protein
METAGAAPDLFRCVEPTRGKSLDWSCRETRAALAYSLYIFVECGRAVGLFKLQGLDWVQLCRASRRDRSEDYAHQDGCG